MLPLLAASDHEGILMSEAANSTTHHFGHLRSMSSRVFKSKRASIVCCNEIVDFDITSNNFCRRASYFHSFIPARVAALHISGCNSCVAHACSSADAWHSITRGRVPHKNAPTLEQEQHCSKLERALHYITSEPAG